MAFDFLLIMMSQNRLGQKVRLRFRHESEVDEIQEGQIEPLQDMERRA
jgi:uncharacterized membrane protein